MKLQCTQIYLKGLCGDVVFDFMKNFINRRISVLLIVLDSLIGADPLGLSHMD